MKKDGQCVFYLDSNGVTSGAAWLTRQHGCNAGKVWKGNISVVKKSIVVLSWLGRDSWELLKKQP